VSIIVYVLYIYVSMCVLEDAQSGLDEVGLVLVQVARVESGRVCVVEALHAVDELLLVDAQLVVAVRVVERDVRHVDGLGHDEDQRRIRRRRLGWREGDAEGARED
jgi:hypothetical protein